MSGAAGSAIAVIALSGRFPGAADPEALWTASLAGQCLLRPIARDEALRDGVAPREFDAPGYVPVKGVLEDAERFDPSAFGYGMAEAAAIDPQQRVFLEECARALDRAALDPARFAGRIGIYAGQFISTYLLRNLAARLASEDDALARLVAFQGNTVDQLATRVAHRLDLRGPAMTLQTACSTSLVAVHAACSALLAHECDAALAGGVAVSFPLRAGYVAAPGSIHSPSGRCRPFDAASDGTVFADGAGVLVLRRLADAEACGDPIRAVILGTAINNDGARKVGYTAPSLEGQVAVLTEALGVAEVAPEAVGLVETHGAGTALGDRIEIAALATAYCVAQRTVPLAIGATKSVVGHLEAAAGVAGMIRAVHAVESGTIPAIAGLESLAPGLDADGRLLFPRAAVGWPTKGRRIAGVSAFGIGGTNAHVVLAEAPRRSARPGPRVARPRLIPLSATSPEAFTPFATGLKAAIEARSDLSGEQATLALGRPEARWRAAIVAADGRQAAAKLAAARPQRLADTLRLVLVLPGQGSVRAGAVTAMARAFPAFESALDSALALFARPGGIDLRRLLETGDDAALAAPLASHCVTVAFQLAAGDWLDGLGLRFDASMGHSIGELVAAARAGVLDREDLVRLAITRGALAESAAEGAMLAVALGPARAVAAAGALMQDIAVAVQDSPDSCVLAGPVAAIDGLSAFLAARRIASIRLPARRAYHSPMLAPIEAPWREAVDASRMRRGAPFISALTGAVARDGAATPDHWVDHLLAPVRGMDALRTAVAEAAGARTLFVEIAAGASMTRGCERWLRQEGADVHAVPLVAGARMPAGEAALAALGTLWSHGAKLDWSRLAEPDAPRCDLPPRGFARSRCFVLPPATDRADEPARMVAEARLLSPTYRRAAAPSQAVPAAGRRRWLIVGPATETVAPLVELLLDRGQIVTVAVPGAQAGRLGRGVHALPDGSGAAWTELMRELKALVRTPTVIVDARSLDPDRPAVALLAGVSALVEGLLAEATGEGVRLLVVTPPSARVLGTETPDPRAAALAALCRSAAQEAAGLTCATLDFEPRNADAPLSPAVCRIIADTALASPADQVFLRGERLFTLAFDALPATGPPSGPEPIEPAGVYLVTGGEGGLGGLVAADLRRRFGATVIALSRHADEGGGRGLRADVADRAGLGAAVDRLMARHGRLDGVVHAAGIAEMQPVRDAAMQDHGAALHPKVGGLAALAAVLAERGLEPRFVVAFSSTAALVGGPLQGAYAAANAAMDAVVDGLAPPGATVWRSILWDTVRETGMARALSRGPASALASSRAAVALDPAICTDLFLQALAAPERTLVATRLAPEALPMVAAELRRIWREAPPQGTRPDLATAYVAPRDEIEERVAEVFARVLGMARVGVEDHFSDLGGHSLLAAQLRSELNRSMGVELRLADVFDADTVAAMARLLERIIGAELDRPEAAVAQGGLS